MYAVFGTEPRSWESLHPLKGMGIFLLIEFSNDARWVGNHSRFV